MKVSLLANAVDDRGVFLVDARAFCTAQHFQSHIFQSGTKTILFHPQSIIEKLPFCSYIYATTEASTTDWI
jgi:hypothetical protein